MLFSVIIPAYNADKFIKRSIASVLNQTFTDFELIFDNDGSNDMTGEYARSFEDKRLFVIDKENEGVSVARNTGISLAKGEFICFLDADDEYLPEHLSTLSDAIKDNIVNDFFVTRFNVSMIYDNNKTSNPKVTNKTYFLNFHFVKSLL